MCVWLTPFVSKKRTEDVCLQKTIISFYVHICACFSPYFVSFVPTEKKSGSYLHKVIDGKISLNCSIFMDSK